MASKRKTFPTPLRRIVVYVDEPELGWFTWALSEVAEDLSTWSHIEATDD